MRRPLAGRALWEFGRVQSEDIRLAPRCARIVDLYAGTIVRRATYVRGGAATACESTRLEIEQSCARSAGGSQRDVTAVDDVAVADDVLEVEAPSGAGEPADAAAGDDRMLAAALDLLARGDVGVPLRLELVGGGEQPVWAAIEAADEDLTALLDVDAAWCAVVRGSVDLEVQASLEAAGEDDRRSVGVVLVTGRRCREARRRRELS